MAHDLVVPRDPSSLLTDHLSNVIKFTSFTRKLRVEGTTAHVQPALGAVAETTASLRCLLFNTVLFSCKLTTHQEARAHSSGICKTTKLLQIILTLL
jgi:hypothetical protein